MTLQERLRGLRGTLWGDDGKTLDEAMALVDALERELRQHKAASPLCDKHKPTGGARSMCLVCAGEGLSAALSRISYACQAPNEYECSDYDVHCSETAVVHQVRDKIDALEREIAALQEAAERMKVQVVLPMQQAMHELKDERDALRDALGSAKVALETCCNGIDKSLLRPSPH